MAATRLLMRRLRELLRLKYDVGLSDRAVAQACAMGLGTSGYLQRATARACRGPCPPISMTPGWKHACLRGQRSRRPGIGWSPTGASCTKNGRNPGSRSLCSGSSMARRIRAATATANFASGIGAGRGPETVHAPGPSRRRKALRRFRGAEAAAGRRHDGRGGGRRTLRRRPRCEWFDLCRGHADAGAGRVGRRASADARRLRGRSRFGSPTIGRAALPRRIATSPRSTGRTPNSRSTTAPW